MTKTGITFPELRELLLELGLIEQVDKAGSSFAYPKRGTLLLFRNYRPSEPVPIRDLLVACNWG